MHAPGRRGAAAAPDHRRVRVQRGLLLRRVRARRPASSARSTKAGASPTRRSPTNAASTRASSSSTSSSSRSCSRLALESGAFDDDRLAAPARAGLRRGAPVPAAQLAHRCHASAKGRRPGPEGSVAEALLERDEQAAARHRDGGARPGRAAVARRRRATPATARGSARGSTTRRRRSGPARTRSSATSSASACSACPASRRRPSARRRSNRAEVSARRGCARVGRGGCRCSRRA